MLSVRRRKHQEKVRHHVISYNVVMVMVVDPRIAQWFDKMVKQLIQHNANRFSTAQLFYGEILMLKPAILLKRKCWLYSINVSLSGIVL